MLTPGHSCAGGSAIPQLALTAVIQHLLGWNNLAITLKTCYCKPVMLLGYPCYAADAALSLLCCPCCAPPCCSRYAAPAVLPLLCCPCCATLLCYPCCAVPAVLPLLCCPCCATCLNEWGLDLAHCYIALYPGHKPTSSNKDVQALFLSRLPAWLHHTIAFLSPCS